MSLPLHLIHAHRYLTRRLRLRVFPALLRAPPTPLPTTSTPRPRTSAFSSSVGDALAFGLLLPLSILHIPSLLPFAEYGTRPKVSRSSGCRNMFFLCPKGLAFERLPQYVFPVPHRLASAALVVAAGRLIASLDPVSIGRVGHNKNKKRNKRGGYFCVLALCDTTNFRNN